MKCSKCLHYYRITATAAGYNPYPCCRLYEDTGERPNVLTRECFRKRPNPSKKKEDAK